MSKVRVLVGTRKGAFVLASDGWQAHTVRGALPIDVLLKHTLRRCQKARRG